MGVHPIHQLQCLWIRGGPPGGPSTNGLGQRTLWEPAFKTPSRSHSWSRMGHPGPYEAALLLPSCTSLHFRLAFEHFLPL